MAILQILSGSRAGECFELTKDQTVVGRYPFCDIILNDHTVSREHFRIVRTPEGYFAEDLRSLNGTFVNGERISGRTRLQDRDRLQIYEVTAAFFEGQPVPLGANGGEPDGLLETELPAVVDALDASSEAHLDVNPGEKLQAILAITRSLGNSLDVDEVLQNILDGLFRLFPQTKQAFIQLPQGGDGQLMPAALKNRGEEGGGPLTFGPVSQSVAERVFRDGEAVLSSDLQNQGAFNESVLDDDFRSIMCAPLVAPGHGPLGIVHIESDDPRRPFDREDLEVLVSVAMIAGQSVQYARIHESALKLDRRARELALAREVQQHFLPAHRPVLAGYAFFDFYRPADQIGGDYFNYIPLPDGRLAITVADVAGKGISAALVMARLCAEIPYRLAMSIPPHEALAQLNDDVFGPHFDCPFVTFAICVLDPHQHQLSVVNAGHLPPLLRRAAGGAVEAVGEAVAGLPLGIRSVRDYQMAVTPLQPGDVVLLCTDGITDAMNSKGELFGLRRLRHVLARGPRGVEPLGQAVVEHVTRFEGQGQQFDDMCLILLARLAD